MEERQHHLRECSSAGLRRSQKLEILPSPNSKSMGANISWARTFHGREHFMGANIFDVCEYFTCKQIFQDVRIYFDWKRIFCV
jgi:hypothetical protein